MIKCCIFDLDGTLLYTLKTITHYVNLVLQRHGIGSITEEQCRLFIGNGARKLLRRSLESNGIVDEELCEKLLSEYNAEYNSNTSYLTEPYEGIPELLSKLKERGILLGVVSNKPDKTTSFVVSEIFPDVFDITRGGLENIPLKPAPDGIIDVMNKLGVLSSEVMYIGDTGVDMEAGIRAGAARVVGVLWGYRTKEDLIRAGAEIFAEKPIDILSEVDAVV